MLPPLMLTSFKAMGILLIENQHFGFVLGNDNFDCIEVSIHTLDKQQLLDHLN